MKFHKVIVIFNPNSTGDSQKNAEEFVKRLRNEDADVEIEMVATKFAGHAEEIAYEHGDGASTLIISASGDGGYNEVVNGVMRAGTKATVAVLPSGNANDHHRAAGSSDIVVSAANGDTKMIEVMKLEWGNGANESRYAHSYIGLGLTPKVGKALTDLRPGVVAEKWHVLRHLMTFKHVTVRINGARQKFNNLIFATVDRMSKVIKLDENSAMNDGKMEVYTTRSTSMFGMLKLVFAAGTQGISSAVQADRFIFETVRSTLVQLDGEVIELEAGKNVVVTCKKDGLRTLA